jgi:hypothetical protein
VIAARTAAAVPINGTPTWCADWDRLPVPVLGKAIAPAFAVGRAPGARVKGVGWGDFPIVVAVGAPLPTAVDVGAPLPSNAGRHVPSTQISFGPHSCWHPPQLAGPMVTSIQGLHGVNRSSSQTQRPSPIVSSLASSKPSLLT